MIQRPDMLLRLAANRRRRLARRDAGHSVFDLTREEAEASSLTAMRLAQATLTPMATSAKVPPMKTTITRERAIRLANKAILLSGLDTESNEAFALLRIVQTAPAVARVETTDPLTGVSCPMRQAGLSLEDSPVLCLAMSWDSVTHNDGLSGVTTIEIA